MKVKGPLGNPKVCFEICYMNNKNSMVLVFYDIPFYKQSLARLMLETTKYCYVHNMLALDLMVSEKKLRSLAYI